MSDIMCKIQRIFRKFVFPGLLLTSVCIMFSIGFAYSDLNAAPSITVTNPNGGEEWYIGKRYTINWTSQEITGNIKIEYTTNGGSEWKNIVSSTDNDGIYQWTIPDDPSTNCLVRVSDLDADPSDASNAVFTISPPSIEVTFPNGGEELYIDSEYEITWIPRGTSGTVKIEYTTNGGSDWNVIISSTDDDSTFDWTIPDEPSPNCLVRVSDTDGDPSDISDAVFSISPASIEVIFPNGGEELYVGSEENITWTSRGTSGTVKIEYSTNSGINWTEIISNTDDDESYLWKIPDELSTNCLVRVSDTDGVPSDESNAVFTISPPSITMTSPNGGEELYVDSDHDITWTSKGTSGTVKIDYSTNSGTSWTEIISSTDDDGTFKWTIPDELSETCLVKVSDTDGDPFDESDSVFSISPPSIEVTSPNGGEVLYVDSDFDISWTSRGTSGTIKIQYSTNNGTSWTEIVASTDDDGNYNWTVPDEPSTTCLVRVSDTDGDPMDESDAVFTISEASIEVTSPNGGEVLYVDSEHEIMWTSNGTSGTVKIEYSINSGTNWIEIISSTADDGSYNWKVPDDTSTACLVKVSDTDGDPFDESDAVFSILPPSIEVTSPNGGEVLYVDSDFEITWISKGTSETVKIEYSTDNGTGWTEIVSNTDDDGSYNWKVPDDTSTACLVKVGDTEGAPQDESDAIFTISPPSIEVTSPNGGEVLYVDGDYEITWISKGNSGTVRIEYSINSGTNWIEIVTSTDDDESYLWKVPDDSSLTCLVRVSDTDGNPVDESDSVFTISLASIIVTSPNGGEKWYVDSYENITWTSEGSSGDVKIAYSIDEGVNWTEIVGSTDDDGNYEWKVPNTLSTTCLVKVSDTDDDPTDVSDSVFTILPATMTITSPNGGEQLLVDSEHEITWNSSGTSGTVKIEYSTNNGSNWTQIVAGTDDDGSYIWNVPDEPSTQCLIKLCDTDSVPRDVSDSTFTIFRAFIEVISPNGGEELYILSNSEITWNSAGTSGTVRIDYSTNNGTIWTEIVDSTEDDGSYTWSVPDEPSTECLVKVSDIDGDPFSESDSVFTIKSVRAEIIYEFINYPNPFSVESGTTIEYYISGQSSVSVNIYDMAGDLLIELSHNGQKKWQNQAGRNSVTWDGRDFNGNKLANGVYICELIAVTEKGKEEHRYRKIAIYTGNK